MKNKLCFLIFLILFSSLNAEKSIGYITYSTINVGDDFQAIAAKRFLSKNAVSIDRDFINEFYYPSKIPTVVSGWFMQEKNSYWDIHIPPPEKSWPPSASIDPFFISIHFTDKFLPTVFSEENINYLKEHAPIGARDLATLNELQKRDIPSYFSGCLTLTLENPYKDTRNDIIYLVDLDEACINYIKSKTKSKIVILTHGRSVLTLLNNDQRLRYAENILDLYRKAKCVVTTRLHAAMPCLAFETPVLMIGSVYRGTVNRRFSGLIEHTWNCSGEELWKGEVDYDFDNPPENPKTFLHIRENLIKIMTDWVRQQQK
jgi:hypothetical protein